jgi:hypothetical protein
MRRLFANALAGACALASACQGSGTVGDLTLTLSSTISETTRTSIQQLVVSTSGLATTTVSYPLAHPFADHRQERLVVRASSGGMLNVQATALDNSGMPVAVGQTSMQLVAGKTIGFQLTLAAPGAPPPDGGPDLADLAGADLAGADLAGADLAGADMATGLVCAAGTFCDDFETGDISRWNLGATQMNGTVMPDKQHAHSGIWSLKAHLQPLGVGASGQAEVVEKKPPPPSSSFWMKMYVYLPTLPGNTESQLVEISSTPPSQGLALGQINRAPSLYDDIGGTIRSTPTTMGTFPKDQWVCLLWHVSTAAPQQMDVTLGTTSLTDLHLMEPTTNTPALDNIAVGLGAYSLTAAQPAVDVWIDDVLISPTAITCP